MARRILSGLIWGTVIAVGGAAVVSVSNPLPQAPTVASAEPEVSAPAASAEPAVVPDAPNTSAQTAGEQPSSPAAPQTDTLEGLETADTDPGAAPSVGAAAPLPQTSALDEQAPDVSASVETPRAPTVDTMAPDAPETSEELTISTEPAQPAPPPAIEEASGFGTEPDAPEVKTVVAPDDTTAKTPVPETTATDPNSAIDREPVTEAGDATAQADPEPRVAALPRVEAPAVEPAEEPEPVDTATTAPSPSIGQPVRPLTDRETGGSSLPSVAEEAEEVAEPAAEPAPAGTPFERHAAPFENPEDKPLMSIVLIDDEGSIGTEALASFPYPLSFAINPFDPEAEAKMTRYRAAGFEVLALMDLPPEATAQDAETALEVGLSTLSEAVGVIEGTATGVQGNRALSDQITAILRDKGYGFVTQNSGLNTVQQLALRDGVPSAFVFRDFDGAGQTPTVMRRFLDQAAFRAGQEGGVIMMGRVRPDTVSALLLWGLQDRASRVALAPVSAVLSAALPE